MSTGAKEARYQDKLSPKRCPCSGMLFTGEPEFNRTASGWVSTAAGLANSRAVAVEILIPGLLVVLFFAWLASSTAHWRGNLSSDLTAGCASLGRGGNPCVARRVRDDQFDRDAKAEADRASFGKGGRVCFTRPASEVQSN